MGDGAQDLGVDEPPFAIYRGLIPILFEFDEVPEGKWLSSDDLRTLVRFYGSTARAGIAIGVSEAFVRQNADQC